MACYSLNLYSLIGLIILFWLILLSVLVCHLTSPEHSKSPPEGCPRIGDDHPVVLVVPGYAPWKQISNLLTLASTQLGNTLRSRTLEAPRGNRYAPARVLLVMMMMMMMSVRFHTKDGRTVLHTSTSSPTFTELRNDCGRKLLYSGHHWCTQNIYTGAHPSFINLYTCTHTVSVSRTSPITNSRTPQDKSCITDEQCKQKQLLAITNKSKSFVTKWWL